jgi:hypothetical protein
MKTKGLSFPFICFHLLFGIGSFQRVTADSKEFFLTRLARDPLCAGVLAILAAAARKSLSMASFI